MLEAVASSLFGICIRVLSLSTGVFEDGDRRQGQKFGQREEEDGEGSPDLFLRVTVFLLTSDTLDCGLEGDEMTTDGWR